MIWLGDVGYVRRSPEDIADGQEAMQALQGGQVGGLDQLQQSGNQVPKVLQAEAVGEVGQALQGGEQKGEALPQVPAS